MNSDIGGTAQRIYECGVPFSDIDKIFYTHLHRSNDLFKQSYLPMNVSEFRQEGIVYDDGKVRITAYPVEHTDGNPAYGCCVEYQGAKVLDSVLEVDSSDRLKPTYRGNSAGNS